MADPVAQSLGNLADKKETMTMNRSNREKNSSRCGVSSFRLMFASSQHELFNLFKLTLSSTKTSDAASASFNFSVCVCV
jgi:hypothetical protein